MKLLIRLYPTKWRNRYGHELEQQGIDMPSTDLKAIRRGVLVAGTIWLALSAGVLLTNVVFPSRTDDDAIPVLLSYLGIFTAMFLTGFLAARDGASRKAQALTGLLTGAMIGALTIGTFAVVDNVWLDIVAQQPTKIDGFARSGAGSMREFINDGLIGAIMRRFAG